MNHKLNNPIEFTARSDVAVFLSIKARYFPEICTHSACMRTLCHERPIPHLGSCHPDDPWL